MIAAHKLTPAIGAELERLVTDALIIYGRRFLENYQRMIGFLTTKARDIKVQDKKAGAVQFTFFMEKRR